MLPAVKYTPGFEKIVRLKEAEYLVNVFYSEHMNNNTFQIHSVLNKMYYNFIFYSF